MTVAVVGFHDAMKAVDGVKHKHLLLGNGFSIALRPDIFTYGSLYDNADFSKSPHIPKIFDALKTRDFELVIRSLEDTAIVLGIYDPKLSSTASRVQSDAAAIKDALVSAIAKRHPDRPYDVTNKQYASCRTFLSTFDHIFTLNYDVLLYWALMQDEVDDRNLSPDDGFRHPEADPNLPYVSWQQSQSATVHYLHGALHLFDQQTEIIKYTWSKTDKAIVDQVRSALDEGKYPLFVAEGTSESKMDRIMHSAYLHKALRSFESCSAPQQNAIVIFGHSLAENDAHVLKCISNGGCAYLLVGLYGDPSSKENKIASSNVEGLVQERKKRR